MNEQDGKQFLAKLRRAGWREVKVGDKVEFQAPGRSAALPVDSLATGQQQQKPGTTLDQDLPKQQEGTSSLAYRVLLVATIRGNQLDDDNLTTGMKPLRDAIANTLGIDDGDPKLKFEYGQVKTDSEEGVMVKIERIS